MRHHALIDEDVFTPCVEEEVLADGPCGVIWTCGLVLTVVYSKPHKVGNRLRPNSAGIPYTLLLRIEAIGFPTFWLLL